MMSGADTFSDAVASNTMDQDALSSTWSAMEVCLRLSTEEDGKEMTL